MSFKHGAPEAEVDLPGRSEGEEGEEEERGRRALDVVENEETEEEKHIIMLQETITSLTERQRAARTQSEGG
jgi:hypothetical protein